MTTATPVHAESKRGGLRIPGFGQLQRLGKSLMLPIALLPAAGILLRLGQEDLLGQYNPPVIGPFFDAMSAAGGAIFANLPLLFAVGVAIGFARKADGSTALSAVAGYLVVAEVFKAMSPIVLAGETTPAGEQAMINYSVFAGIIIGVVTAWLFDRYHTIQLPPYLGFFGGRRFVPIVVSLASLFIGFGLSYLYPLFDMGLTGIAEFIGGSGAIGAFVYGFVNRMLIPLGLHHIVNTYIWFLYGEFTTNGATYTGELTRFANGDPEAGRLTSGFYPILMFGLPGAALAMIHAARATPEEARRRHPLRRRADRLPDRRDRAARVRLHVRRLPPLRDPRGADRAVPGARLHLRHPPRLLVLGRSDRPPPLRHGPGCEEHSAAGRDGPGLLRPLLRAVPLRDHPLEPAHPGSRPRGGRRWRRDGWRRPRRRRGEERLRVPSG